MEKEKLTKEQMRRRTQFVDTLLEKGWDAGAWETLFNDGHDLCPEAALEYDGHYANLRLSYYLEKDYLLFECCLWSDKEKSTDPEDELTARLYPRENLDEILNKISFSQNNINTTNDWVELIDNCYPFCQNIYLGINGTLVELKKEEQ